MNSLIILTLLSLLVSALCLALGSVSIPFSKFVQLVVSFVSGKLEAETESAILFTLRLPRVLGAGLSGAALSVAGCAMQGLIQNPLADGSTLGVSAGAGLGALLSLLFGVSLPLIPLAGRAGMAIAFAFLTLISLLLAAYSLDKELKSTTIILCGIVFSMFISAAMSLIIAFAGPKIGVASFWMLGSLSGLNMQGVGLLTLGLVIGFGMLFFRARELNAFSLGENSAVSIGVSARPVKLEILVAVSILVGVCVAVGGSIAFVGLIIPHIARFLFGGNHLRLLPATAFMGAVFLQLCDLAARTLLSPLELPVGVVTSLIGALFFISILMRKRGSL